MNFDTTQYSKGSLKCLLAIDFQLMKLKQHETSSFNHKKPYVQGIYQFKILIASKGNFKKFKLTKFYHKVKVSVISKAFQNVLVNIKFKIATTQKQQRWS